MNISKITPLLSLILVFVGCEQKNAHQDAKEVSGQIIKESINRYEIVKNSGNAMDTCIQAGIVKNTMLATQNETGSKKWISIEKKDCEKAGAHR